MQKLVPVLLFLVLYVGMSRAATTQIVDTLKNADRTLVNGTMTISWSSMSSSDGTFVKNQKTYAINNGVVNITLESNVGAAPGSTYYTVQYNLREGTNTTSYKETWIVPQSDTPIPVSQVRQAQITSPIIGVNLDQVTGLMPGDILVGTTGAPIALHAPSTGTYCLQSLYGSVSWATCAGISGGHITWSTLGHTTWAAIGHKQWESIGN